MPRPHPDAVVGWCHVNGPRPPGRPREPVWVAHSSGGLAVQWDHARGYEADERKAKPHQLFVSLQHPPSGLRVVGFDASDVLLPATFANYARILVVRDELLKLRVPEGDPTPTTAEGVVDWTRITEAARASDALFAEVRAIRARHLPGKPAWRASRARSNGAEFSTKWFASRTAAAKWLEDWTGSGYWRAIEHWTSRPPAGSPEFANTPDHRALARGEFPSPSLARFYWSVGRTAREAGPGEPPAPVHVEAATDGDLAAWHDRLRDDDPRWHRAPTGELDDVTERLLASGLLRHVPASHVVTTIGGATISNEDYPLTRAGLRALTQRTIEGRPLRGEYSLPRTTVALEKWRKAKREHVDEEREHAANPNRFGGTFQAKRQRILSWLRLLRCVARDRASASPPVELPEWRCPDAWTEVLALRGGVGEVVVKKPGEQWRWYSFVAAPVVSWAPGCAVRADPKHETRDHAARDWCEKSADELRRLVSGEPEPAAPPAPTFPHPATRFVMRPRGGDDRALYLVASTRARAAAVAEMGEATVAAAEVDVLGWDGSADLERDMRGCLERELDADCLGTLSEAVGRITASWTREQDKDEVRAAIARREEMNHGHDKQ